MPLVKELKKRNKFFRCALQRFNFVVGLAAKGMFERGNPSWGLTLKIATSLAVNDCRTTCNVDNQSQILQRRLK